MPDSLGPLGKTAAFPHKPDANILFAVPRSHTRTLAGLSASQLAPFGRDIFTAWEFSWRDGRGRPRVAVLRLIFDASAPALIESKSLKLYLHGFAQERFDSEEAALCQVTTDLAAKTGGDPRAFLLGAEHAELAVCEAPEPCIDQFWRDLPADRGPGLQPEILQADSATGSGALVSHTFGSLCPVTGQPDWASIRVGWTGTGPQAESFLQYLEGFRQHQGFHEACVDTIFAAIAERCRPTSLCVMAQFTRRGGIEIAPVRGTSSKLLRWVRLCRL